MFTTTKDKALLTTTTGALPRPSWYTANLRGMPPPVTSKIGAASLQLDRAYKAIAPMTDKPVKIGSISAQILALMLTDEHYKGDRLQMLMDLSAALNRDYHALADAGAPLVQIEEPAIHQIIADPNQKIPPQK